MLVCACRPSRIAGYCREADISVLICVGERIGDLGIIGIAVLAWAPV